MIKCILCGGILELFAKTRRRVMYKCSSCGRELAVRKYPKDGEEGIKQGDSERINAIPK